MKSSEQTPGESTPPAEPMNVDDPAKPEFASWRSYQQFAHRVLRTRRYLWSAEVRAFLDTVLATSAERAVTLEPNLVFYRAQLGIVLQPQLDEDGQEIGEDLVGYDGVRMKPLLHQANEGRVNPVGIPVLYLGSTELTAIAEVRPWVGSQVSVAQFKTLRALKAVDLSRRHGESTLMSIPFGALLGEQELDAARKAQAVWTDIDNAFSRPVMRSDGTADYVPTQILAELFNNAGYDALIYRSQFGEQGYNLALFNVADAEAINCAPYEVVGMRVEFREIGNRWFSQKHHRS